MPPPQTEAPLGSSRRREKGRSVWCAQRREAEWRAKCEAIETREAERRAREETKHAEETAFLNRANKQLKQQLDKFLQEPPAAAKK